MLAGAVYREVLTDSHLRQRYLRRCRRSLGESPAVPSPATSFMPCGRVVFELVDAQLPEVNSPDDGEGADSAQTGAFAEAVLKTVLAPLVIHGPINRASRHVPPWLIRE